MDPFLMDFQVISLIKPFLTSPHYFVLLSIKHENGGGGTEGSVLLTDRTSGPD